MRTLVPEVHAGTAVHVEVPFADCFITDRAQQAATAVLQSGWVTTGLQTLAFEHEFAAYVEATHAIAVSSCTMGIELALRSLRLPPGSRVLVSTVTFCGAVHAIVHAGLRPVLVDVNPETAMPDESTTRSAAQRAGGVAAMVVVHWAGDPADVPALATAAGLTLDAVVEDAAHAIGSRTATSPVGSGSAATCFSFYATKNLPIGDGGMVVTEDAERAAYIRRARLHGMSEGAWRRYLPGGGWRYDVGEAGLKANMTDVEAAIGRAQLTQVDTWQMRRAEIADRYDQRLSGLTGITIPHRPAPGHGVHAWHLYPIRVAATTGGGRDEMVGRLLARGIGTSVHFIPVHQFEYFKRYGPDQPDGMPGADAIFPTLLSLPMYPRLTDEQVDCVCDAVAASIDSTTTPEEEIR